MYYVIDYVLVLTRINWYNYIVTSKLFILYGNKRNESGCGDGLWG